MERKIISHVCCLFFFTDTTFIYYILIFFTIHHNTLRVLISRFLINNIIFRTIVYLFHRIILFTELILHYSKHFYTNYTYLLHIQIIIYNSFYQYCLSICLRDIREMEQNVNNNVTYYSVTVRGCYFLI